MLFFYNIKNELIKINKLIASPREVELVLNSDLGSVSTPSSRYAVCKRHGQTISELQCELKESREKTQHYGRLINQLQERLQRLMAAISDSDELDVRSVMEELPVADDSEVADQHVFRDRESREIDPREDVSVNANLVAMEQKIGQLEEKYRFRTLEAQQLRKSKSSIGRLLNQMTQKMEQYTARIEALQQELLAKTARDRSDERLPAVAVETLVPMGASPVRLQESSVVTPPRISQPVFFSPRRLQASAAVAWRFAGASYAAGYAASGVEQLRKKKKG